MALSDTILDAGEEIKEDLAKAKIRGKEMYLPWHREKIRSLAEELIAIGMEIGDHPDRWHESDPNVVSVEHAKEILDQRSSLSTCVISTEEKGSVNLEGNFRLPELEALCVLIRAEHGSEMMGAPELIAHWRKRGMLDEQRAQAAKGQGRVGQA